MKSIRHNVFETNSSSTHSLSIYNSTNDFILPKITEDIEGSFGEFGWENETYSNWNDKLSYLLTMILETEAESNGDIKETIENIENSDGFKLIDSEIYKNIGVHMNLNRYKNIKGKGWDLGYIDHQSCENYNSLRDYLEDYDIDIIRYLFDTNVVLETSNDNQ